MTAVARPATAKLFAGSPTRVAVAGNAVAAACILANWWRAADTSDLASNLSSAGLAITGIAVAGLANALWLLTARGAIARRRISLSRRVSAWGALLDGATPPATVPAGPARPAAISARPGRPTAVPPVSDAAHPASGADLIAVDGATRYHRPGCPLVSRKRTSVAAADTHRANGLRPCGVCEPAPAADHDGARP